MPPKSLEILKTLFCVPEAPRDQDLGLKDYVTGRKPDSNSHYMTDDGYGDKFIKGID